MALSPSNTDDTQNGKPETNNQGLQSNNEVLESTSDNDNNNETDESIDVDDLFGSLISELDVIQKNKKQSRLDKKLDSNGHIIRLVSQAFPSPYQVFGLGPEATKDDIRREFRKISLHIHPDKCRHPRAQEAFHILKKAYEDINKEEIKEKYKTVFETARKIVYKKHKLKPSANNIDLVLAGFGPEEQKQLEKEIYEQCDTILANQAQRKEYAERTLKANQEYEKRKVTEALLFDRIQLYERMQWDENMDNRVNSWRTFKEQVDKKEVKFKAFKGVDIKKEERSAQHKEVLKQTAKKHKK